MASITKKLKSFRSVTSRAAVKHQRRRQAQRNARSGSNCTHLLSVGKAEIPQGNAGGDSSLPEPVQCTILFPLPDWDFCPAMRSILPSICRCCAGSRPRPLTHYVVGFSRITTLLAQLTSNHSTQQFSWIRTRGHHHPVSEYHRDG